MRSEPGTPVQVRLAGVLVGLQATLAVAATIAGVVLTVRAMLRGEPLTVVAGSIILFGGCAAGLIAISRGLLLGRRGARAPAVVVQLLLLPVVYSLLGPSHQVGYGVIGGVVVGAVLFGLLCAPARVWAAARTDDPAGAVGEGRQDP